MEKKIYPVALQKQILREAKEIVLDRYGKDKTILAIYLGGSVTEGKFGVYKKPVKVNAAPRIGSDIDVMLVIKDRFDWAPLPKKDQKHYGIRHIGPVPELTLYRMTGKNGDIFLGKIHPIELLIMTKDYFLGCLSGKYRWGEKKPRKFANDVKKLIVWKETPEIRKARKKYAR
jgi:hypothetical protein